MAGAHPRRPQGDVCLRDQKSGLRRSGFRAGDGGACQLAEGAARTSSHHPLQRAVDHSRRGGYGQAGDVYLSPQQRDGKVSVDDAAGRTCRYGVSRSEVVRRGAGHRTYGRAADDALPTAQGLRRRYGNLLFLRLGHQLDAIQGGQRRSVHHAQLQVPHSAAGERRDPAHYTCDHGGQGAACGVPLL